MMKNSVVNIVVIWVMKLLELFELNSVVEVFVLKEVFILVFLFCCSMIRFIRLIVIIRKIIKRVLYIINLFFVELLCINVFINKVGFLLFFIEVGVNIN